MNRQVRLRDVNAFVVLVTLLVVGFYLDYQHQHMVEQPPQLKNGSYPAYKFGFEYKAGEWGDYKFVNNYGVGDGEWLTSCFMTQRTACPQGEVCRTDEDFKFICPTGPQLPVPKELR